MLKNFEFVYKPLPELQAGRQRLHELKDQARGDSELHEKCQAAIYQADERLKLMENRFAVGQASSTEVQAARQVLRQAEEDLSKHQPSPATDKAIRDMCALIETLERQEQAENWNRFAPLYKAALKELDQALEAARIANEQVHALQLAGGILAIGLVGAWPELSDNQSSKLSQWRKLIKEKLNW